MKTVKQNAGAELLRAALAHSDCYNAGDYDGLAGCLARAELELAVDAYRDAKPEPAVSVTLTADASQALEQLDAVLWRLSEIQRIADAFAVPVELVAPPIVIGERDAYGSYFVRVSPNVVDELTAQPSSPVTVSIERFKGRELDVVLTEHKYDDALLPLRKPTESFVLAAAIAWYRSYVAVADGTETRRAKELASSVVRMLDA